MKLLSCLVIALFVTYHCSAIVSPPPLSWANLTWVDYESSKYRCEDSAADVDWVSSGACEKYMTGPWCVEPKKNITYCNATNVTEAFCEEVRVGCQHPLKILTIGGTKALPLMHVNWTKGPIDRCLMQKQHDKHLHFLFIGDSQTRKIRFELERWMSHGTIGPIEFMKPVYPNN
jgi:hypothetical protein